MVAVKSGSLEDILKLNIFNKNVVIVGMAATGKTFLSKQLMSDTHRLISLDDYKYCGYEESLYMALEQLNNVIGKTIVEGCLGYRLLRKWAEEKCRQPDIVINCIRPRFLREKTYLNERDPKKIKNVETFNKGLQTVWNQYLETIEDEEKKPNIIEWDNVQ